MIWTRISSKCAAALPPNAGVYMLVVHMCWSGAGVYMLASKQLLPQNALSAYDGGRVQMATHTEDFNKRLLAQGQSTSLYRGLCAMWQWGQCETVRRRHRL